MADNKIYWSGLEELDRTPEFEQLESQEFPVERPVDEFLADDRLQRANTGRRDFLKFMGFSVTAATLAACETPVVKSIPYTNKPAGSTPASTRPSSASMTPPDFRLPSSSVRPPFGPPSMERSRRASPEPAARFS